MFDTNARRVKERVFYPLAVWLQWAPPQGVTWLAWLWGMGTAVLLTQQQYGWALLFWFLNRLFDGLDGMVARLTNRQTDLGGYLDIVLDFVVYAAVPIGLVLGAATPVRYVALVALLAVFYVNGASWMYLAAILEKRQHGAAARGEKTTVTMPPGLIGGVETILFYSAFILFPGQMVLLFAVMAGLTAVTIGQRLVWAYRWLQ
ncbi:MAG: CDP-alcohol phosphatidyltransferase family protein [Anaerolinea sp.]|nr:CDP-alcohol phosphatidyltransferase family protein [Anaerolinea sp.]